MKNCPVMNSELNLFCMADGSVVFNTYRIITGMKQRIIIRPPLVADQREFIKAALASASLHRPWVKAPATRKEFAGYLKRMDPPSNYAFLVVRKDTQQLCGVVNLTNVVFGLFRSGYLSYYAFGGQDGKGLMREGLDAVVRHSFGKLRLHQLEANIRPDNTASIALVRACGFSLEGFSPKYLKIGGRWRGHERWAIIASSK
jgi:[ribosomal protein S5]-alanine N-acetyltransferase